MATGYQQQNNPMKLEVGEKPPLAKHDSSILDLAFAIDVTASMGSYIDAAQQSIRQIVEEIVSAEKSDIRLALVEYRDHPPQDQSFVTRTHDFTDSVKTMKSWLEEATASGGGDQPEAVADALHDVLKLSWRPEATKICVLVSDAPPHGLISGIPQSSAFRELSAFSFGGLGSDGFPTGCPNGLDPVVITNQMAKKSITIYFVGCEPAINPYRDFFMALAHITGGQYVPLRNAKLLSKVIIGGAQEEITLQRLMEDVHQEVVNEMQARGGSANINEDVLVMNVFKKLSSQGAQTKVLFGNGAQLATASGFAQNMASKGNTLAAWRGDWAANKPREMSDRCINGALGFGEFSLGKSNIYGGATGFSFGGMPPTNSLGGSTTSGGLFGSTSAPTTFGYFGAVPCPGFGARQPATSSSVFGTPAGQPAPSGGLFGSAERSGTCTFGSSGGPFGSSTGQPASSGGLFGTPGQPAKSSAFGSSTKHGAPSGGLFGSSAGQPVPLGGLFGTPGLSANSSGFGSSTEHGAPSGGLFGSSAGQPASSGGLFGTPGLSANSSGFGSSTEHCAPSGGLFGSSTGQSSGSGFVSSVGQPAPPGGLFGTPAGQAASTGGLFGSSVGHSVSLGGLFGLSSGFGSSSFSAPVESSHATVMPTDDQPESSQNFSVVETNITLEQAKRMVKKSIAMNSDQ